MNPTTATTSRGRITISGMRRPIEVPDDADDDALLNDAAAVALAVAVAAAELESTGSE